MLCVKHKSIQVQDIKCLKGEEPLFCSYDLKKQENYQDEIYEQPLKIFTFEKFREALKVHGKIFEKSRSWNWDLFNGGTKYDEKQCKRLIEFLIAIGFDKQKIDKFIRNETPVNQVYKRPMALNS